MYKEYCTPKCLFFYGSETFRQVVELFNRVLRSSRKLINVFFVNAECFVRRFKIRWVYVHPSPAFLVVRFGRHEDLVSRPHGLCFLFLSLSLDSINFGPVPGDRRIRSL